MLGDVPRAAYAGHRDLLRIDVDELWAGGSASRIPKWAESQNNIGHAQKHFLQVMADVGAELAPMSEDERREHVVDWLENAEADWLFMASRLKRKKLPLVGRRAPTGVWLDLIEAVAEE